MKRGNNTETAYEVYAQYWADLTDRSGNYGVSVLNDSKYGWDKPDDNTLRLTLLHTPKQTRIMLTRIARTSVIIALHTVWWVMPADLTRLPP